MAVSRTQEMCSMKIEQVKQLPDITDLLIERGRLYKAVGLYRKAKFDFDQVYAYAKRHGHPEKVARALLEIANLAYLEGYFKRSIRYLMRAEIWMKKQCTYALRFLFWRYKGNTHRIQGNFRTALACYRRLLKYVRKEDMNRKAVTHNLIGLAYLGAGDPEKAVQNIQRAYKIFNSIKDLSAQGSCLANVGYVYTFSGRAEKALTCFNKAISLLSRIQAKSAIATPLLNWGTALYELGRIDEALQKWNEALLMNRELGDFASVAMLHNNIGTVLIDKKEFQQSIEHLQTSLRMKKKLQLTGYLSSTYNGLAKAYSKMFLETKKHLYRNKALKNAKIALSLARTYKKKYDIRVASQMLAALKKGMELPG